MEITQVKGCYQIPPLDEDETGGTLGAGWTLSSIFGAAVRQVIGIDARPQLQAATVPRGICLVAVGDSVIKSDPHISHEQRQQLLTEKTTVEDFYRAQSYQVLGSEVDRVQVPVWIHHALHTNEWKKWLEHGIREINEAAPGLHLYTVPSKAAAKIHVYEITENRAYTVGNIIEQATAEIHLGRDWRGKERTATHEMLHALGFKHEQQREDSDKAIKHAKTATNQVLANKHILGISRFDPYSIMLYSEGDNTFSRKDGEDGDPVWKLKSDKSRNIKMSELDKVGLNLLYRPCKSSNYNPMVSSKTGMVYCGRDVMSQHNIPASSITEKCGPDNSANCPACRTINTSKVEEIRKQGKWQGWSGLVYCKRKFGIQKSGHDGYCGPNNGPPCPECRRLLKI